MCGIAVESFGNCTLNTADTWAAPRRYSSLIILITFALMKCCFWHFFSPHCATLGIINTRMKLRVKQCISGCPETIPVHMHIHNHTHLHSLTFIRIHTVPQHSHGIGVASASSFFSRPNCDKHSHAAAATKLQSRNRGGGVGEEGGMEPVGSGGGVPSPGDS